MVIESDCSAYFGLPKHSPVHTCPLRQQGGTGIPVPFETKSEVKLPLVKWLECFFYRPQRNNLCNLLNTCISPPQTTTFAKHRHRPKFERPAQKEILS